LRPSNRAMGVLSVENIFVHRKTGLGIQHDAGFRRDQRGIFCDFVLFPPFTTYALFFCTARARAGVVVFVVVAVIRATAFAKHDCPRMGLGKRFFGPARSVHRDVEITVVQRQRLRTRYGRFYRFWPLEKPRGEHGCRTELHFGTEKLLRTHTHRRARTIFFLPSIAVVIKLRFVIGLRS